MVHAAAIAVPAFGIMRKTAVSGKRTEHALVKADPENLTQDRIVIINKICLRSEYSEKSIRSVFFVSHRYFADYFTKSDKLSRTAVLSVFERGLSYRKIRQIF